MPIPVLTLPETREVEKLYREKSGISEYDMILSAGEAVFLTIQSLLGVETREEQPAVAFVCGKGHNGADALAAACLASEAGFSLIIYQLHGERYSPETSRFQERIREQGHAIHFIKTPVDLPVFQNLDLIVDGLLGTGVTRPVEGLVRDCIHGINRSGIKVLSIDTPSGVFGDSPKPLGQAIRADATLCLAGVKLAACLPPAMGHFGKLGYSPICFDEEVLASQPSGMSLYTREDAVASLPKRRFSDHKYSAGKILVLAGSTGMHGAALLASRAALRAGAGMVRLVVPERLFPIVANHCLEIICMGTGDQASFFVPEHLDSLNEWLGWPDTLLVGPGLGKAPETLDFLRKLIQKIDCPVLLDGDGQVLLQQAEFRAPDQASPICATPHAGEFIKIGGSYDYDAPMETIGSLRKVAADKKAHILLKGAASFFCSPEGVLHFLPVGNPGMATAGTGDILAGICAAFLAKLAPEEALPLSAFVHGRAGDLAAARKGMHALIASDMLEFLPQALCELEEAQSMLEPEDNMEGEAE